MAAERSPSGIADGSPRPSPGKRAASAARRAFRLRGAGRWLPSLPVVLLGLLVIVAPASGTGARTAPTTASLGATLLPYNHTTPHIQHVVVIVMENQGATGVWQNAPFARYLSTIYGNATGFYAACHPSAGNYLGMIMAVTNQCGSDAWHNDTNRTLGDLFQSYGLSWLAYAENLPAKACADPANATVGLFATRHVPFLYSAHVLHSLKECHHHVHTGLDFRQHVQNGTLANFSFYTPNLCDDGHTGCGSNTTSAQLARQGDAWLRGFLTPMLNHSGPYNTSGERAAIAHTLFVVTYDEGSSNAGFAVPGLNTLQNELWCLVNGARGLDVCGGRVYTVFVSPYSLGRTFSLNDSFYGLVQTIEWLFHLPHLQNAGHLDYGNGFPAMRSMFSFTSNGH